MISKDRYLKFNMQNKMIPKNNCTTTINNPSVRSKDRDPKRNITKKTLNENNKF